MNSNIRRIALAAQRKSAAWSWLNEKDVDDVNRVGAGILPRRVPPALGRRIADAQDDRAKSARSDNRADAARNLGTMAASTLDAMAAAMPASAAYPVSLPLSVAASGAFGIYNGIKALRGGKPDRAVARDVDSVFLGAR